MPSRNSFARIDLRDFGYLIYRTYIGYLTISDICSTRPFKIEKWLRTMTMKRRWIFSRSTFYSFLYYET